MLNEQTVQIEHLNPMRIAVASVKSETPEYEAISLLLDWARPQGLLDRDFRFFGHDNCEPFPNHIYTTWLTVDSGVQPSGSITIEDFAGGLFAVLEVDAIEQISPRWKEMMKWLELSEYAYGGQPGLEEYFDVLTGEPRHFKLYLSIKDQDSIA